MYLQGKPTAANHDGRLGTDACCVPVRLLHLGCLTGYFRHRLGQRSSWTELMLGSGLMALRPSSHSKSSRPVLLDPDD